MAPLCCPHPSSAESSTALPMPYSTYTMFNGKKPWGGLSRGGCPGGVVRIIAGLSKGLSGPRRLASTCTCHNHTYNQKHGAAKEVQPEMSLHFLISPPVRSSSLVSPFRFRSRTLLQCSFQNSCADWGHVAVEASSGQGTSAQRHPPTSGVVWPVSPETSSQLWVQRCCATFSSQFCLRQPRNGPNRSL